MVLSKRGVFAFSAPLGTDPITLTLILLQRQSCLRRKKEKGDGHRSRVLGRGWSMGSKQRDQIFAFSQHQRPLVPGLLTAVRLGRERERWSVVSQGGKQTGCLGPSPDSSPGLPGMAITGPLLAAPRAIKAGELREPSAKCR